MVLSCNGPSLRAERQCARGVTFAAFFLVLGPWCFDPRVWNLMKIVILDGYTSNPGDLSWAPIKALGDCVIHERSPPETVVERAGDAECVLTNKTVLDRETLNQLPRLRYIGVLATGFNVVDVGAARERGIPVTHIPAYGTRSVAQMTFALLLELTHHVGQHAASTRSGGWTACPDFCYWERPLVELDGRTLGLVGYGRIARATAAIAEAMGMRVIAFQPSGRSADEVELVDLDTLLGRADVISLHCPLTENNAGMIDARRIGLMKPDAFLINTARGQLINEKDLADALNSGRIAGAAVDVLSREPPTADNPLLHAENCLVTPHMAWATRAARARLIQTAADNLRAFLDGKARNVVN